MLLRIRGLSLVPLSFFLSHMVPPPTMGAAPTVCV